MLLYPHFCGGRMERFWKKNLSISTPDKDLNLDLPIIGSLVYWESSALEHVTPKTEALALVATSLTYTRCSLSGNAGKVPPHGGPRAMSRGFYREVAKSLSRLSVGEPLKLVHSGPLKPVQNMSLKHVQNMSLELVQDKSLKPVQNMSLKLVQDKSLKHVQNMSLKPVQNMSLKLVQDKSLKPVQNMSLKLDSGQVTETCPEHDKSLKHVQNMSLKLVQDKSLKPVQNMSLKLVQDKSLKPVQNMSLKLVQDKSLKLVQDKSLKLVQDKSLKHVQNMSLKLVQDKSLKHFQNMSLKHVQNMSLKHVQNMSLKHVTETGSGQVTETCPEHVTETCPEHVTETCPEHKISPLPTCVSHLSWLQKTLYSTSEVSKNLRLISLDDNVTLDKNLPLQVHIHNSEGRPLVVLLAWLMAREKHLMKYASFYLEQGFDVLMVNTTPWQFLWPVKGSQTMDVLDIDVSGDTTRVFYVSRIHRLITLVTILQENVVAGELLEFLHLNKCYQKMLLHGFSVGGYMWGETLLKIIPEPQRYTHVVDRIVGQIWDSAVDISEIPVGVPRAIFQRNLVLQATAEKYIRRVNIYVMAADFVSCVMAADFVSSTYVKCWDKSPHVGHFRKHPKEYVTELATFLDRLGLVAYPEKIEAKLRKGASCVFQAPLLSTGYRPATTRSLIGSMDIPDKCKGVIYNVYYPPIVVYTTETWVVKEQDRSRMQVGEMRVRDRIEKARLRWYGPERRGRERITRRRLDMGVEG
uniref:Uncharacterized protein n=1 Tax=Timema douglasi TaxID=61478 RepID=A0A7R8Z7C8_TIMDO|nr:unnamed protein product [Timema douglasi]